MFKMDTTPAYRQLGTTAAQAAVAPRGVLGTVLGGATFGLFPGTPPYRAAPATPSSPPLCCEPEVHVVEVVGLDEGVGSAEGPAPEEGPPTCKKPVTIVIKRKDKK